MRVDFQRSDVMQGVAGLDARLIADAGEDGLAAVVIPARP
jgi:hypothetical protein